MSNTPSPELSTLLRDISLLDSKYDYSLTQLKSAESIRLLHLLPCPPSSADQTLRCDLTVELLSAKPIYSALSYTWGEDVFPETLTVGNTTIPLTQNLYDALVQLRKSDEAVSLWVDAVCINQEDSEEKADQIPLMAQIYSNATEVHIWLGKADVETCEVAQYLKRIGGRFVQRGKDIQEPRDEPGAENEALWADVTEDANLEKIELLWKLPWFTRRWVVQELAFARRALLHCGSITLEWKELAASCVAVTRLSGDGRFRTAYLEKNGREFRSPGRDSSFRILTLMDMVDDLRQVVEASGTTKSLFRFVANAWPFECKEDKDRVLSMLGIFNHGRPHQFKIDGRLSAPEIYKRFALHCYEFGNPSDALDMLSYAGSSYHSSGRPRMHLPSWVPDWRVKFKHNLPDDFKAAFTASASIELAPERDELLIRGLIVDRVKHVLPPISSFMSENDSSWTSYEPNHQAQWYAELEKLFSSHFGTYNGPFQARYIGGGTDWEALMRTLVLNRKGQALIYNPAREAAPGSPIPSEADTDSPPFHYYFMGVREILLESLQTQAAQETGEALSEPPKAAWRTYFYREYQTRAYLNCLNRSFYIGERGFMGLGPEGMKSGDIICLPAGAAVPYVLRPEDTSLAMFWQPEPNIQGVIGRVQLPDGNLRPMICRAERARYQLIGECYTEGIMYGEAWDMDVLGVWEAFVLF